MAYAVRAPCRRNACKLISKAPTFLTNPPFHLAQETLNVEDLYFFRASRTLVTPIDDFTSPLLMTSCDSC